ncbi:hypothetical protein [Sporomusa malonica]|uniref:Uncharacterized protein n=1 Tax=Sporomusa malonica TaxID=112901 RepID=A0A1W1ZDW2_9FIRM|nr:hypothetical protein [Sporomusa malonica]SMC46577.1 hypothetical protein SAMN04488500_103215 [Sporomusa malonica]
MENLQVEKVTGSWFKCKNDLKVVTGIHLALVGFIIIAGYGRIGGWSQKIVNMFFIDSLWLVFVYIGHSMWPFAIALIIISIFLCIDHYWKWIFISWVSLSIIGAYSIGLYGFKVIPFSFLAQATATLGIIHLPVFACLSGIVYFIRTKKRED